jgi:hypothetical protein
MISDMEFMGLKVGDLATWAGAIGSVLAAIAAWRAARIALRIAQTDAERREMQVARRAEVHAAYIFNQILLVYGFADPVQAMAEVVRSCDPAQLGDRLYELMKLADGWRELLNKVPASSIAELPDECAAPTAGAVSSVLYTIENIDSLWEKFKRGNRDYDRIIKIAELIIKRCVNIRHNFHPYIAYAKERFGYEVE